MRMEQASLFAPAQKSIQRRPVERTFICGIQATRELPRIISRWCPKFGFFGLVIVNGRFVGHHVFPRTIPQAFEDSGVLGGPGNKLPCGDSSRSSEKAASGGATARTRPQNDMRTKGSQDEVITWYVQ
jgi:hypothetical protein